MKTLIILSALFVANMLSAQNYDYDDIYFDPVKDIVVDKVEKEEEYKPTVSNSKTTLTEPSNLMSSTSTYTQRLERFNFDGDDTFSIEGLSPYIGDSNYVNLFMLGQGSYNVTVDGDRIDIESTENYDSNYAYESQIYSNPSWGFNYGMYSPFSYWDMYFYNPFYYGYNHCHHYCGYVPYSWWRGNSYNDPYYNNNNYYAYKNSENDRRRANLGNYGNRSSTTRSTSATRNGVSRSTSNRTRNNASRGESVAQTTTKRATGNMTTATTRRQSSTSRNDKALPSRPMGYSTRTARTSSSNVQSAVRAGTTSSSGSRNTQVTNNTTSRGKATSNVQSTNSRSTYSHPTTNSSNSRNSSYKSNNNKSTSRSTTTRTSTSSTNRSSSVRSSSSSGGSRSGGSSTRRR